MVAVDATIFDDALDVLNLLQVLRTGRSHYSINAFIIWVRLTCFKKREVTISQKGVVWGPHLQHCSLSGCLSLTCHSLICIKASE